MALSVYTPLVHRPQQGLLIVTCACSAPSQLPVSQMHAGRFPQPPRQLPHGREVVGMAIVLERGGICQGERQLAGPWPSISPLSPLLGSAEDEPWPPPYTTLVCIVVIRAKRWAELPVWVSVHLKGPGLTRWIFPLRIRMNCFSLCSALLSLFTTTFSTSTRPLPSLCNNQPTPHLLNLFNASVSRRCILCALGIWDR